MTNNTTPYIYTDGTKSKPSNNIIIPPRTLLVEYNYVTLCRAPSGVGSLVNALLEAEPHGLLHLGRATDPCGGRCLPADPGRGGAAAVVSRSEYAGGGVWPPVFVRRSAVDCIVRHHARPHLLVHVLVVRRLVHRPDSASWTRVRKH